MKKLSWKFPMERLKKYRYPALILAVGILLLCFPAGKSAVKQEESAAPETEESFDLEDFTRNAEDMLSELPGAGQVKLLLTLETDGRWEYLTDRTQSQGESTAQAQEETVLVSRDGDQYPVTVVRSYPSFRGAVVVCGGGGSTLVLQIKEALSSLTGLGMDKITVICINQHKEDF